MMDIVDKMAFSNYLPLMTRATADDNEPTPGYMLEEIEKITFLAAPHCNRLGGYLLQRLGRQSNNVKLKVLKIMHHLVIKGHVNFRVLLRRNDGHIKMSTVNASSSNSFGSSRSYDAVAHAAQNLLHALFDPNLLRKDEEGTQEPPRVKPQLGALGSQGISQGKYVGFGNSAADKDSIKGKVMDYFEKLLNPADDLNEDIKYVLYSSAGNYEPPVIEDNDDILDPKPVSDCIVSKEMKAHIPGRAGGGWETDEEDEPSHCDSKMQWQNLNTSAVTSSSESIERLDILTTNENTAEAKFVEEFCKTKDFPVMPSELDKTMNQCNKYDGIKIIQSLFQFLVTHSQAPSVSKSGCESEGDTTVLEKSTSKYLMMALLFLEWFLQIGKVAPEICSAIMMPALLTLVETTPPLPDINTKTRKLIMILSNRKKV